MMKLMPTEPVRSRSPEGETKIPEPMNEEIEINNNSYSLIITITSLFILKFISTKNIFVKLISCPPQLGFKLLL